MTLYCSEAGGRDNARIGCTAASLVETRMRPRILVALRVFPEVLDKLRLHFDVEANEEPVDWGLLVLAAPRRGRDEVRVHR